MQFEFSAACSKISLQSAAKSIRETSGYIFQTTLTDLFSFDALTPQYHFVLLKHYCELSRPCLPCQAVSRLNFSIGPSILFPASTNALLSHELFVWPSLLFSPLAGSHQHSFPPNKKNCVSINSFNPGNGDHCWKKQNNSQWPHFSVIFTDTVLKNEYLQQF